MKNKLIIPVLFICLTYIQIVLAQEVVPVQNGSLYSLTFAGQTFEVNAEKGARVSTFSIGDSNIIKQINGFDANSWGSVVWPAPQSEFNWPPPRLINNGVYSASIDGNVMTFASQTDKDGKNNQMQVIKSFWVNESDTSFSVKYSLINKGTSPIKKAIWEIARVPLNGISFWPTGSAGTWGALASSVQTSGDYSWINISKEPRRRLKFFADGAQGWFAHIDESNRLFVKTFEDVDSADFADGEGEIELWIAENFIELENLGVARTLNTDDALHYEAKWILRQLPDWVKPSIGDEVLIDFVKWAITGKNKPQKP
ncbi:MAG: hypothetical protein R6X09_01655 [Bacteroidales bacterium]